MIAALALVLVLLALMSPTAADASGEAGSPDRSPFPIRGIVEGAYGRPWTSGERPRVLRWMARHGMNTYIHAPKDDLYQRTRWRDPYPAADQRAFDREIRLAERLGIEWIPNLSPALPLIPTPRLPDGLPSRDLCFSCPADLQALRDKLRPFLQAGARTVAISFDDVTKTFSHLEDIRAYGVGDEAFGRACGDVLTRLRASLARGGRQVELITVGADYAGTSDTPFLRGLRSTLARGIDVMWTGNDVPSTDFTARQARDYGRAIGRRPVVWDNWTNTDTAGSAIGPDQTVRLFLGPYSRRRDVGGAVRGFLLNPANEAFTNFLPLATAADYLADPGGYRRRRSFASAVAEAVGRRRDLRGPLRAFAETMWSSKLDRDREAPTFVARRDAFLAAYDAGGLWPSRSRSLARELRLVAAAPTALASLPNRALRDALLPFERSAARAAHAGQAAVELLAAERPRIEFDQRESSVEVTPPSPELAARARQELIRARLAFDTDPRFTYGWRTPVAIELPPYPVGPNAMGAYIDAALARDLRWLPLAPRAAAGVDVTVNGRPRVSEPGGTIRVRCGDRVAAVDRAGGRTAERIPCPVDED